MWFFMLPPPPPLFLNEGVLVTFRSLTTFCNVVFHALPSPFFIYLFLNEGVLVTFGSNNLYIYIYIYICAASTFTQ